MATSLLFVTSESDEVVSFRGEAWTRRALDVRPFPFGTSPSKAAENDSNETKVRGVNISIGSGDGQADNEDSQVREDVKEFVEVGFGGSGHGLSGRGCCSRDGSGSESG